MPFIFIICIFVLVFIATQGNNTRPNSQSFVSSSVDHKQTINLERVCLGSYPQTESGEKKDITWLKIKTTPEGTVLISQYALDCQPGDSLEEWLNSEFRNQAFTEQEGSQLIITLPSKIGGLDDYLGQDMGCIPTDYAVARGVLTSESNRLDTKPTCWWWFSASSGAIVNSDGSHGTANPDSSDIAVRPVIVISHQKNETDEQEKQIESNEYIQAINACKDIAAIREVNTRFANALETHGLMDIAEEKVCLAAKKQRWYGIPTEVFNQLKKDLCELGKHTPDQGKSDFLQELQNCKKIEELVSVCEQYADELKLRQVEEKVNEEIKRIRLLIKFYGPSQVDFMITRNKIMDLYSLKGKAQTE